ncbi:MAG: HEAT repeat domain-containing protein, partial [Gemmatimonadota bacterium]|nr:HEAT repeat domain-containing protein [Gemmatimonadota bacterium]
TVTAAYDTAARTLTLHVAQTQQDTLKPDRNGVRFQVDTAFRMPVTIRVGTADGDVVQHAWLDARDQTIAVSGVRTAPTMVVFDDGNHIVKGLTFDQPTAWLVTQLAKDPNLWNREWAIGQLARRTDEPAAAAALGAAADRADYFLTRRQAVEALGAFPPASAMAAVTAALRDTASAVRSAAVTALGRLGGTDAVTRLREAFAHDPSYDVRAAAVSALVQADTAHADGVLARALMTPSYREVIRHAALEGVARLQDTARTKDVEGLIALDAEPAQVLGVLATRGDSTALQALLRHIDDDRSGVRRYVVGGFALALRGPGRAEILGRLRQAAPLIMHADTKQQVQGVITEAEKGAGG